MSEEREAVRRLCHHLMMKMDFNYELRRVSIIWAARSSACPLCSAGPFQPCLNLKQLRHQVRVPTRWPHDERIDWDKLLDELKKREALSGQEG